MKTKLKNRLVGRIMHSACILLAFCFVLGLIPFTSCQSDDDDASPSIKVKGAESLLLSTTEGAPKGCRTLDMEGKESGNITLNAAIKDAGGELKVVWYVNSVALSSGENKAGIVSGEKDSSLKTKFSEDGIYQIYAELFKKKGESNKRIAKSSVLVLEVKNAPKVYNAPVLTITSTNEKNSEGKYLLESGKKVELKLVSTLEGDGEIGYKIADNSIKVIAKDGSEVSSVASGEEATYGIESAGVYTISAYNTLDSSKKDSKEVSVVDKTSEEEEETPGEDEDENPPVKVTTLSFTAEGATDIPSTAQYTEVPDAGLSVKAVSVTDGVVNTTDSKIKYQWQKATIEEGGEWSDITGATEATLAKETEGGLAIGYKYRCKVFYDGEGVTAIYSQVASISSTPITPTPTITEIKAGATTIIGGEAATTARAIKIKEGGTLPIFSVTIKEEGTKSYKWFIYTGEKPDSLTPSSTAKTFTPSAENIDYSTAGKVYNIYVEVTNKEENKGVSSPATSENTLITLTVEVDAPKVYNAPTVSVTGGARAESDGSYKLVSNTVSVEVTGTITGGDGGEVKYTVEKGGVDVTATVIGSSATDAIKASGEKVALTFTSKGVYTVTATNSLDSDKKNTLSITISEPVVPGQPVYKAPTITSPAADTVLGITGGVVKVTLTGTVPAGENTGGVNGEVKWSVTKGGSATEEASIVTEEGVKKLSITKAGDYTVTATNSLDDTKHNSVTVKVIGLSLTGAGAKVPNSYYTLTSVQGSGLEVRAVVTNGEDAKITYTWYKKDKDASAKTQTAEGGEAITGATSGTLNNATASFASGKVYYCEVGYTGLTIKLKTIAVEIGDKEPSTTPNITAIKVGASTEEAARTIEASPNYTLPILEVTATPSATLSYIWHATKDGAEVPLKDNTGNTLNLATLKDANNASVIDFSTAGTIYTFYVVVTNEEAGKAAVTVDSKALIVTLTTKPYSAPTFNTELESSYTIDSKGKKVDIKATLAAGESGTITYKVEKGGNDVTSTVCSAGSYQNVASNVSVEVEFTEGGTYTITATSSLTPSVPATKTITIMEESKEPSFTKDGATNLTTPADCVIDSKNASTGIELGPVVAVNEWGGGITYQWQVCTVADIATDSNWHDIKAGEGTASDDGNGNTGNKLAAKVGGAYRCKATSGDKSATSDTVIVKMEAEEPAITVENGGKPITLDTDTGKYTNCEAEYTEGADSPMPEIKAKVQDGLTEGLTFEWHLLAIEAEGQDAVDSVIQTDSTGTESTLTLTDAALDKIKADVAGDTVSLYVKVTNAKATDTITEYSEPSSSDTQALPILLTYLKKYTIKYLPSWWGNVEDDNTTPVKQFAWVWDSRADKTDSDGNTINGSGQFRSASFDSSNLELTFNAPKSTNMCQAVRAKSSMPEPPEWGASNDNVYNQSNDLAIVDGVAEYNYVIEGVPGKWSGDDGKGNVAKAFIYVTDNNTSNKKDAWLPAVHDTTAKTLTFVNKSGVAATLCIAVRCNGAAELNETDWTIKGTVEGAEKTGWDLKWNQTNDIEALDPPTIEYAKSDKTAITWGGITD